MKNCAIVCEYNPFHTGHEYQIKKVRAAGADNIFCVMSGSFVQSGMPAFCDKSLRAKCAVTGGADAVIELPAVYATASAQLFAEGALKIITDIKNIEYMAMGATAPAEELFKLAEIKTAHADKFNSVLREHLDSGKSYNAASASAFCNLYDKLYTNDISVEQILCDPNNILCIEYVCAIYNHAAKIEPLVINRVGRSYNDEEPNGDYVSATAIRRAESVGNLEEVKKYIPFCFDDMRDWRIAHSPNTEALNSLYVYALKHAEPQNISRLRNCSEGMEYLLKNLSFNHDFNAIIDSAIGRRYGKKRLHRLFLDLLLNIDKSAVGKRFVTRLLACRSGFDFTMLPSCVKTSNADIKRAVDSDAEVGDISKIDQDATALFNTICRVNGTYFNYSLVKV